MPKSFAKFDLIGNLIRKPEIRYTPNGKPIAEFSVAINDVYRPHEGAEPVEETSFFDCKAFGKLAELLQQYTDKGSRLYLAGSLKQDRWEDRQTGQKRSKVILKVTDMTFLGEPKGQGGGSGGSAPAQGGGQQHQYQGPPRGNDFDDEDDIPF